MIAAASIVYLEGYLWDPPHAKEAFLKAAKIAHEAERESWTEMRVGRREIEMDAGRAVEGAFD